MTRTTPDVGPHVPTRTASSPRPTRVVVVGGGISGLSLAWRLLHSEAAVEVVVLERDTQAGGTARSHDDPGGDGVVERGPCTFMSTAASLRALISELGLDDVLIEACDHARRRWLFLDGRLQPVPTSPLELMTSSLLTPAERVRLLCEPLTSPAPPGDETVFDFARRHLGQGAARNLVEPLLLGITAGDARELSMAALFPHLHRLEGEHRSLALAVLQRGVRRLGARMRGRLTASIAARSEGRRTVMSLRGGIGTLTSTLATRLGRRVCTGVTVERIARGTDRRWQVDARGADGEALREPADVVVLATPAHASARLIEPLDGPLSQALTTIPYAGVQVATLGYRADDVREVDLDGFGFLVGRGEDVRMLGCLYLSSMFPQHVAGGQVLVRVIAGGVLDPGMVELDADDALAVVRRDLEKAPGIRAEPLWSHVERIRKAIPQYTAGHHARLDDIDAGLRRLSGLHLVGNAYRGLGLEDCVRRAGALATHIAESLEPRRASTEGWPH